MSTDHPQPRNPLHGIKLEQIVTELHKRHGWKEMAARIPVRCFMFQPSIKSSLAFLRKTPWAREKVEAWYVADLKREQARVKKLQPKGEQPPESASEQGRDTAGGHA